LVSAGEPLSRASLRFDGADDRRISIVCSKARIFRIAQKLSLPTEKRIRVVPYSSSHQEALLEIASAARGSIYITAEELEQDVEFTAVDELYRGVGLRRMRHVWLAYRANKEEPIGRRLPTADLWESISAIWKIVATCSCTRHFLNQRFPRQRPRF